MLVLMLMLMLILTVYFFVFDIVNCQKACKKCDDGRPCQRCIKYSLVDTCTNSVRKERKKGIKRGPYKKRKTGGKLYNYTLSISFLNSLFLFLFLSL